MDAPMRTHAAFKRPERDLLCSTFVRVSATFSCRLIGTLHSGCCNTTSAGLAHAGESSAPTREPLGLRSKSNRKCSRKPNKVILMIAISAGSPRRESETSLSLSLPPPRSSLLSSCLVKAEHVFFFSTKTQFLNLRTWRSGNRRLEVWKLITLITELLSILLSLSLCALCLLLLRRHD